MKILNKKELQFKILIGLECTYTDIDKQLAKEEQIKIISLSRPFNTFNTFNTNRTRSGNYKVTWFAPLKLEIKEYTENINVVILNINVMNIFLEHNQLVKHNIEVHQNKEIIQFI